MKRDVPAPFSRLVDAREVSAEGLRRKVEASPAERVELARMDGLVAIAGLVGDFSLRRRGRAGLLVTGEVRARVTRTCVVSLEPFDVDVAEEVRVVFAPPEEAAAAGAAFSAAHAGDDEAALAAIGATDPPDPIVDGKVDLGALAAEFLSLALDPWPRKPGAELPAAAGGAGEPPSAPFAALDSLRGDGRPAGKRNKT